MNHSRLPHADSEHLPFQNYCCCDSHPFVRNLMKLSRQQTIFDLKEYIMNGELCVEISGNAENCGQFIQQLLSEKQPLLISEQGWLTIPAELFESLQDQAALFECALQPVNQLREAA